MAAEHGFSATAFIQGHDHRDSIADFYKVDKRKLGEGTYGTVSKAIDRATNAVRAVKIISKKAIKDKGQFQREVDVQRMMDHPHICKLYATFEDKNNIYLVLELCNGGELFDRISDKGEGMGESQSAEWMKQIIGAVFYMHEHQMMHRDLKPENFLLETTDEDSDLKVIDFGLAAKFEEGEKKKTKAGTPYYVAPQVLRGAYGEKCDVWSCGVIVYVLLCGYPPFYGENDKQILGMVKKGKFDFPGPEWDSISPSCKDLISKMLTLEEKDRISAKDAVAHQWIVDKSVHHSAPSADLALKIRDNFQKFRAMTKFKKIAMTMIAQRCEDKDIIDLREAFLAMDKDGNGVLTYQEITEAVANTNSEAARTLQESLRAIDTDKSGEIEYTEFLAATFDHKKAQQENVLSQAFNEFDLNHDGVITREELQQVLSGDSASEVMSQKEIQNIIAEVDRNGDGEIDFDEFCKMMRGESSLRG